MHVVRSTLGNFDGGAFNIFLQLIDLVQQIRLDLVEQLPIVREAVPLGLLLGREKVGQLPRQYLMQSYCEGDKQETHADSDE